MSTPTIQSYDPAQDKINPNITMTKTAIGHFKRQLEASSEKAVRLFIEESGCSGYMYRVDLVSEPSQGDITIQLDNAPTLYVQSTALGILKGTEIDYKTEGLSQLVKFNNPNVTAECGCGESFVVESN